ncbi:MAG TPA: hypothetical protein DC000_02710 [Clostridiales bacterium]|nr:hypothetical protein [Clostridiales bacterium]
MKNLVILDAGHGLDTVGKRTPLFENNTYMRENEFNRVVVRKIYNILEKYEDVDVFISATEKIDISLNERVQRINTTYTNYKKLYPDAKCILISVHANALNGIWGTQNGTSTHYYPTNKVDKAFAEVINKHLTKKTSLKNRGNIGSDFQILREPLMSCCLCECAFMDNVNEAKLLLSDDFRNNCAEGITNGILEYLSLNKTSINVEVNRVIEKSDGKGITYEFEKKSNIKTTYGVSEKNEAVRFIKMHPYNMAIWEGAVINNDVVCKQANVITNIGYGVNGIFFGAGKRNINGKDKSIWAHAGIFAVENKVLCEYSCHAAPWEPKNNWFPQRCLVYYKDNSFDIVLATNVKEITKPYYWIVSGIGLYPTYDPASEGFVGANTGALRFTDHTSIGVTSDGFIMLARSYQCDRKDTIKHMRDLGCILAIGLDGGGSTQYRVPGLQRPSSSSNMRLVPSMILATDLK